MGQKGPPGVPRGEAARWPRRESLAREGFLPDPFPVPGRVSLSVSRRFAPLVGLAALLVACSGRPTEVLPSLPTPTLAENPTDHPKLAFADGSQSANDRCPVTKRKLSVWFPPIYVNGKAIGFC